MPISARRPAVPPSLGRLIRVVRAMSLFGAAGLLLVPLVFWTHPDWVQAHGRDVAGLSGAVPITVDSRALALGLASSVPATAVGLWGLLALWRLFGAYAQGRFFDGLTRSQLKHFAGSLLGLALLGPVVRSLVGIALTWGNPPGQRMLVVGFSGSDYLAVLVGLVLLAIATVQAEAAWLADENAGFV